MSTTIENAQDLTSLLVAMPASERLALIAQAQAEDEKRKAAEAEALAIEINKFTAVHTSELGRLTDEMNSKAQELGIPGFKIVIDGETKKYEMIVVEPPKRVGGSTPGRRNREISTSISANIAAGSAATVDGETYRSYREAYDELGYSWTGKNASFNARLELIHNGHIVGPPTR